MIVKGMEHFSYAKRLRELGFFRLENRRLTRGSLKIRCIYILESGVQNVWSCDFFIGNRKRGIGHKVKNASFLQNFRKHFFC